MTKSRGIHAALAARTEKTCRACKATKPLAAFRQRRMVCNSCLSAEAHARAIRKGEPQVCPICESLFRAAKRSGGHTIHCSRKCANAALVRCPEAPCLQCGSVIRAKKLASGYTRNFCSLECRNAYRIGPNCNQWKGGHRARGTLAMWVGARPGYSSTSNLLHRVVAAHEIGRDLTRDEIVIHIDRDNSNNVPANLYVCESRSEWRRRELGVTLAWPTASNLAELKPVAAADQRYTTPRKAR